MKHFIVLIGIALATVHTVHSCQCSKPKDDEKVCGSDGETYGSKCLVTCLTFYASKSDPCITRVSDGECGPSPCTCSDTCDYVCGSDGETYGNECTLKCAQQLNPNLSKAKDGHCLDGVH